MTDLVTTRWTKYGKDRLYVKTPDGTAVGHIDLLTGAVEVQVAEFDSEVRALAPQREPKPAEPTLSLLPSPTMPIELNAPPPTSLPTPTAFDLATNAAGAAARAKRQEVNGQAPVWNLVARALGVKTDERAWRVGAKGEEKVGHELAKLPAGWHVLHAADVSASFAAEPWDKMIEQFRSGPPIWTVWAVPVLGDKANLGEFFIHHEDIRRAQPEWEPRPDDAARDDALWNPLKVMGRMMFRKSPVGVTLRSAGRDDIVVKKAEHGVVLVGLPGEILIHAYGRPIDKARVVVQGDPKDVHAFETSPRGL